MRRGLPARGGALALAALLALAACAPALRLEPPPARPGTPAGVAASSPLRFEDVTKAAGIRFRYATDLRRGRMIATMGGGLAMGDYDGDGWLDLFFTGSVANGKKPRKGPCGALYRNRGDGTFEDVTGKAGIRACGWTMGASFVDLSGSGRLDLVVTGLGETTLWENQGDGTFRETSAARGLVAGKFAIGLAAGDVNGDGRPDLYVVDYLDTDYARERAFPQFQVRIPEDYEGQDALLFVQRPDGSFEERAGAAGCTNHGGKGLQAVLFDYDGDGAEDLYVTNDRVTNRLYKGHGDGTFTDVTVEAGAGVREMAQPRAGMGIAVGDVDGDGHPDILVTNFGGEPVTLYRSVEGLLFDDGTDAAGLTRGSWPYVQWGAEVPDLDDDGWPDAVALSGHLVPRLVLMLGKMFRKGSMGLYAVGDQSYRQPAVLWHATGGGRFEEVTATSGDLAKLHVAGRGLAAGDLDGDGRLDLATAGTSGGVHLFRNASGPSGHALEILPVAGAGRRTVLGTKVAVTAGGRRQVQEFILRPSYASGSWVPLHFGIGAAAEATVEVIPPGATGPALRFERVAAGRLYRLRDGTLDPLRPFRR